MFVSYASELSQTYVTLAITRMLEHLEICGVDPKLVEVRTDLDTELTAPQFDYRPEGFHGAIVANKTPLELLREKAPYLHPHILLLHPRLLDSHMGQLLSGPAARQYSIPRHPERGGRPCPR
jgi:hypothetical protein